MGQVMNKLKKGDATDKQQDQLADDLKDIINDVYENDIAKLYEINKASGKAITSDDLYHAIFKIIQELSKKTGAMQYKLPSRQELEEIFQKHHRRGTVLNKEECRDIISELIKIGNFSMGQGAFDILLFIFGAPICALVAKRIIPGMSSISDDVIIPIATTGSVILLAKSNKL